MCMCRLGYITTCACVDSYITTCACVDACVDSVVIVVVVVVVGCSKSQFHCEMHVCVLVATLVGRESPISREASQ